MRIAILSDIHGNLPALQSVLKDVATRECDKIYCLGDVIGYGPQPNECLAEVKKLDGCVLGNHDYGALIDPEGFSTAAEQAIFWTRNAIETQGTTGEIRDRLNYLLKLPRFLREENAIFVHGSVRNPLNEYVFPEDVHNRRKMEKLFSMIPNICFQGHTHVPGVFSNEMEFIYQADITGGKRLSESERYMVNVGSVGQPRDGDWRSCYVVYDHPTVYFYRVEYDVDSVAKRIAEIPELDNFLGERLLDGR
jgi:predicted phosphodiesterase